MVNVKVGDKVRITATAEQCEFIFAPKETSGLTGEVIYDFGGGYDVRFDEEYSNGESSRDVWSYNYSKVELV